MIQKLYSFLKYCFFFITDKIKNKNKKTQIKKTYKKKRHLKKTTTTSNNKRIKISAALRKKVWYTYIGKQKGVSLCLCCKTEEIGQLDFHVGHVLSVKEGGDTSIDNLRPICSTCNLSMGSIHMYTFIKKNGF